MWAGETATIALVLSAALLAGCRGYRVVRVYDGVERSERFISDAAYALYARGVELEARGKPAEALLSYRTAVRSDSRSPELWTRIGAVECALGADPAAAFEAAEERASDYAPLWRARAGCARSRGDLAGALAAAQRAVALDPASDEAAIELAALQSAGGQPAMSAALLRELTVRSPDSRQVWEAVASHARALGDDAWEAHARRELSRIDGASLAAPRSAAPEGDRLATIRRALRRGDLPAARRVARRMRLDPHALAAIALVAGLPKVALAEMERRAAADPDDVDARLLAALAADLAGDRSRASAALAEVASAGARAATTQLGRLALAELLARHAGPEAASAWLASDRALPAELPAALLDDLRSRL